MWIALTRSQLMELPYEKKLQWLINQVQFYKLSITEEMQLAETLGLNIKQTTSKGDK